jgi:hypothetical protein
MHTAAEIGIDDFHLQLTVEQQADLVEYLKAL